jgi:hypothetical protein
MTITSVSHSITILPIEVVDKVLGCLDYGSLFWSVSLVCKEWRARPLVQDVISIYTNEKKACLKEGYPIDLINVLLKHSISIWRLPIAPTFGIEGLRYPDHVDIENMINSETWKPTSLLRYREPTERGLVVRIKCLASIKLKELEPIVPSCPYQYQNLTQFHEHRTPIQFYSEKNVFETELRPQKTDSRRASSGGLLFLTIFDQKQTFLCTNSWRLDTVAFMNYAYQLKGIKKEITSDKKLSQFMEEMVVGDGLFQIYAPPDQNAPPPAPTELLESLSKV